MEQTKKLGFGLMRLPKKGFGIDVEQTKKMVDLFMEAGFTYFDTAHVYPGSEDAIRKALVERYPRDSYTLATKLYAPVAISESMAKKQFRTSLDRTGAGYIDYYLLHSIMESNYEKYDRFNLWDYAKQLKEEGLVRHYGFSFHGGPELLDELLKKHPDVEFVQLQINYADWNDSNIRSRENYEVARKHGKKIVVMEPVKGGNLANPPKQISQLFKEYDPEASCASWAIRFVASLDGILAVLSGMSNIDQMKDNLSYMKQFKPLSDEEMMIIRKAQEILGRSNSIPCTACEYCVKGCPMQIQIPKIFAAMNKRLSNGLINEAKADYLKATQNSSPKDCIECGQCEGACPQYIKIISELKTCEKSLNGKGE
ncbi:MAG: aldo/keto reductase [Erysipelotrichaceae bacterium]|nr:aldo/keto reductase [Erysipelotrichaceae bacterium]